MLTRLQVSGFKNLVNVDLRFGPFTCMVGPNGAGKSNLFDAIRFLHALSGHTLMDAAASVRDQDNRTADVRNLFHHAGGHYAERMSLAAEMVVPAKAVDDLGQEAEASITFLRYSLELAYRDPGDSRTPGSLEITKEELVHIPQGAAAKHLLFPHRAKDWRRSVVRGQRRVPFFISTEEDGGQRIIKLHQDGGSSGRPLRRSAANLPRTVLSVANAAESPTVVVARREMEAWRMLQLEPSALRRPDEFSSPTRLGTDGSHLAATVYRMARNAGSEGDGASTEENASRTCSQIASRLSKLIDDVRDIKIDRDEKRELLTLFARDGEGNHHPARALSDGTLRFLALVVLEMDPETDGVLCLEEPENSNPSGADSGHPATAAWTSRSIRSSPWDRIIRYAKLSSTRIRRRFFRKFRTTASSSSRHGKRWMSRSTCSGKPISTVCRIRGEPGMAGIWTSQPAATCSPI